MYIDHYFTASHASGQYLTRQGFINMVGITIPHEIGHALGLNHTYWNPNDIMYNYQGINQGNSKVFDTTDPALRVALGMTYADPDVPQQAVAYYVRYAQQLAADPSKGTSLPGGDDGDSTPYTPGTGVALVQNAADGTAVGHSLDFGSVTLNGAGNGVSLCWSISAINPST